MKRIFAVIFFLASAALAQGPHVIGDNVSMETTGTGYGKAAIITNAYEPIEFYTDKTLRGSISGAGVFSWAGGINLPNDTFLTADTTAGLVGGISLLKGAATSDNTRLNCNNAKKIEFAENDVVGVTLDPSTNGFTFATSAELGSDSLTDGISTAYFTDGTTKALITTGLGVWAFRTTTNHPLYFGYGGASKIKLDGNVISPIATGTVGLGSTSLGWNGLYLSTSVALGEDKWSLVPGENVLTLAAGADDQALNLAGGSTASSANGATLVLRGATHASAGDAILSAGGAANSDVLIQTTHASSTIALAPNGVSTWNFSVGGNLTQDATNGGNIVMAKSTSRLEMGRSPTSDISGLYDGTAIVSEAGPSGAFFVNTAASANGNVLHFFKSRSTDGTANIIVADGDILGGFGFRGADQTHADGKFVLGAKIEARVDGTPGVNDMPTRLVFSTSPDGSSTPAEAMRISQDKSITIAAGIKSSATDVGWVVRAGGDTACTTTCGANKGCLFGIDAGASAVVACATATADTCLCTQ